MVNELSDVLEDFPGETNRTQCFLHIVNIVAKTLIRQFDIPKAKVDTIMDEAEKQLQDLAKDIDESGPNGRDDERNDEENDNIEGWVDEMEKLPACEHQAVRKSVGPIRFVLVKVTVISCL
jgi:hypothetical protein